MLPGCSRIRIAGDLGILCGMSGTYLLDEAAH